MTTLAQPPKLGLPATIIGLAAGIILTAIGVVFGFLQGLSVQLIILSAIATLAAFVWGWRFVLGQFVSDAGSVPEGEISEGRKVWLQFRPAIYGLIAILALFLILSVTIEGFFNVWNIVSLLIILTIIVLTRTLGRHFQENRSAFIGIMVLAGLFSIGSMNIEGFLTTLTAELERFDFLVSQVVDVVANRINNNLHFVSRLLMFNVPSEQTFTLRDFSAQQRRHIEECTTVLDIKNREIERAVHDVIAVVQAYRSDASSGAPSGDGDAEVVNRVLALCCDRF